jgi:hypothetical protein
VAQLRRLIAKARFSAKVSKLEMTEDAKTRLDTAAAHNAEVGLLCTQWAYLEWMLEIAIWWFRDLLDKSDAERLTETSGKPVSVLAREAGNIAHQKLTSVSELHAMKDVVSRIEKTLVKLRGVKPHILSWRALSDPAQLARFNGGRGFRTRE